MESNLKLGKIGSGIYMARVNSNGTTFDVYATHDLVACLWRYIVTVAGAEIAKGSVKMRKHCIEYAAEAIRGHVGV